MKKTVIVFAILITLCCTSYAQRTVIGVRGGINYAALCGELSYQRDIQVGRIEINIGGALNGMDEYFYGVATYQYAFPLSRNVNWYIGGGGSYSIYDYNRVGLNKNGFMMSAHGQVGIEYYIPHFPIQFSLDWRPALKYATKEEGFVFHPEGIAVGLRFYF